MIGSDLSKSNYSKKEITKCRAGSPVIIASATKQHLEDLKLCLKMQPSEIYVEKGFSSIQEYEIAKVLAKDIPIFILSQYRYSGVFEFLKNYLTITKYNQIDYVWDVEKGEISEWAYHIISLNNFLKGKCDRMIINDEGTYRIDESSDFVIKKSEKRNLSIHIETDPHNLKISLGKNNIIEIDEGLDGRKIEFQNEDCLSKQLKEIFVLKNNKVIERL